MPQLYKYEVNTIFSLIGAPSFEKRPPQISAHHQGHDIK